MNDIQLALYHIAVEQNFEEADRLTSSILRELAGKVAEKRGYVFYSEVKNMSGKDLETIDRLWKIYSQGKFGFSIQAKLLKSVGKRYDLLWPRIGWKKRWNLDSLSLSFFMVFRCSGWPYAFS